MYEHKAEQSDSLVSPEHLDEFAAEGWELIQIIPFLSDGSPGFIHYFRRIKAVQ